MNVRGLAQRLVCAIDSQRSAREKFHASTFANALGRGIAWVEAMVIEHRALDELREALRREDAVERAEREVVDAIVAETEASEAYDTPGNDEFRREYVRAVHARRAAVERLRAAVASLDPESGS